MNPIGGEIAIKDNNEKSYLTDSGRSSLRLLLRNDEVRFLRFCIPNFFCGIIEEILVSEKINYSFYEINEDFSINPKTLNDDNYDVLYIISYFGNIPDLSFVDLNNKILVEDNVFLYNFKNYQNSKNWYAFNSYRKISPLTDGSLIKTNLSISSSEVNNTEAPYTTFKREACKNKYIFISENKSSEIEYLNLFNKGEEEINNQDEIYCISPQSLNLMFQGDYNNQKILKRRFVELQDLTKKKSKLPFYFSFFTFVLSNKKEFLEFMRKNNIFLPNFWPETTQKNNLYNNLVVIPLFYNDIEFSYVKKILGSFLDNDV
tara:strand:+ start:2917 stop:3867 length:951 start_codon:yes stop_codon:yes gene_type:complete